MQPFGARNTTRALTARVSAVLSVFLLCTALGFAAGAIDGTPVAERPIQDATVC